MNDKMLWLNAVTIYVLLKAFEVCSCLTLFTPNEFAIIDEDFTLVCVTDGLAESIRWKVNGKSIATLDNQCNLGRGSKTNYRYSCDGDNYTLIIPRTLMTEYLQKTEWICSDTIGRGNSNTYILNIQIPVKRVRIIHPRASSLSLIAGDTTPIECVTEPSRPTAKITLEKGNQKYQEQISNTTTNETTEFSVTNSLFSLPVTENDDGLYVSCQATNVASYGSVTSQTIKLNISYGPESSIRLSKENIDVAEGMSLQPVVCKASCNPSCNFIWLKNNDKKSENNTLNLLNISRFEAGIYSCRASNYFGSTLHTAEKDIKIKVLYGPGSSTKLSEEYINITEGKSVGYVACHAKCNPRCSYTWWKNNIKKSGTSSLSLPNISRSEAGIYKCKASNYFRNKFHVGEADLLINVRFVVRRRRSQWTFYLTEVHVIIVGTSVCIIVLVAVAAVIVCRRCKHNRMLTVTYKETDETYQYDAHDSLDYQQRDSSYYDTDSGSEQFEFENYMVDYENQGRLNELQAQKSYNDLEEHDPTYDQSHYSTIDESLVLNIPHTENMGQEIRSTTDRGQNTDIIIVNDYLEPADERKPEDPTVLKVHDVGEDQQGTVLNDRQGSEIQRDSKIHDGNEDVDVHSIVDDVCGEDASSEACSEDMVDNTISSEADEYDDVDNVLMSSQAKPQ